MNGTLINYYIHCKRQCYLHANKINLEDNSEDVKIGKALHEKKLNTNNSEISIDNIKIDRLTKYYVIEVKKSDADIEAAKWQLIYYLYKLKEKGIIRKGKLQCIEKNKKTKDLIIEFNKIIEIELLNLLLEIEEYISNDKISEKKLKISSCKKCAYYSYCYI